MEKYREGQKELLWVFVDPEKAYDKVPREEVWYCMRKSGLAEKYVRIVQDMYDDSRYNSGEVCGRRRMSGVICDRRVPARVKEKVYKVAVRPAMLYGLETVALTKRQGVEMEVA